MNELPLLTAEQIEVKVKKVTDKGAIGLLYKTARTDMEVLDQVYGPFGWECSYDEIKGNLYCTIRVYDDQKGCWIAKQDCGIESREDDEGNQKKGEASDAFKRAGFKWGIGRELYSSPFIFLKVATKSNNGKFQLENPFASFEVGNIEYDENKRISKLTITDGKTVVYSMGSPTQSVGQAKPEEKPPEPANVPDPEAIITKQQYAYLVQLITGADKKIMPDEQAFLEKTYREYGYEKAKDIKQKDFQAIVDKSSGKLPFDL